MYTNKRTLSPWILQSIFTQVTQTVCKSFVLTSSAKIYFQDFILLVDSKYYIFYLVYCWFHGWLRDQICVEKYEIKHILYTYVCFQRFQQISQTDSTGEIWYAFIMYQCVCFHTYWVIPEVRSWFAISDASGFEVCQFVLNAVYLSNLFSSNPPIITHLTRDKLLTMAKDHQEWILLFKFKSTFWNWYKHFITLLRVGAWSK